MGIKARTTNKKKTYRRPAAAHPVAHPCDSAVSATSSIEESDNLDGDELSDAGDNSHDDKGGGSTTAPALSTFATKTGAQNASTSHIATGTDGPLAAKKKK